VVLEKYALLLQKMERDTEAKELAARAQAIRASQSQIPPNPDSEEE
jgi:hypothetical protein